jgi:hypothetical protein|tara:strand:+ start:658 stop:1083 length:426 start_codon:yes stop_codon:yes gene_type:complete
MSNSLVNFDAGGLAKAVMGGLDDLFTSDDERAEAELRIADRLSQPHILQAIANVEAAKNVNWFVAGGRPALFWVCAIALLYNWVIKDFIVIGITMMSKTPDVIIPLLPQIDGSEVTGLVATLLGLGGMRMYEKIKGVAREQ